MNVADLVKSSMGSQAKEAKDTFQVWENYRDQATMWRIIALLQLVTTPILILLCIYVYSTRTVTLNVPAKPLPGIYKTSEIPKDIFISRATEFINLVASYQPKVAKRQFALASEMLDGQILRKFEEESLGLELRAIESTARTQLYFVDPAKTEFIYKKGYVFLTFYGERVKFIAGNELPPILTKFNVTMKTVPRQSVNKYGIVINDFSIENVDRF